MNRVVVRRAIREAVDVCAEQGHPLRPAGLAAVPDGREPVIRPLALHPLDDVVEDFQYFRAAVQRYDPARKNQLPQRQPRIPGRPETADLLEPTRPGRSAALWMVSREPEFAYAAFAS